MRPLALALSLITILTACSDPAPPPVVPPTSGADDDPRPPAMLAPSAPDPAASYRRFQEQPQATLAGAGGACTVGDPVELHGGISGRGVPSIAIGFDLGRGAVAWASRGHVGLVRIGANGARAGEPAEIASAGAFAGVPVAVSPFDGGWLVITAEGTHRYVHAFPDGVAPTAGEIDVGPGSLADVAPTTRGLEILGRDRIVTVRIGAGGELAHDATTIPAIAGPTVAQLLADPTGHAWVISTLHGHRIVRPAGTIDLGDDVVSSHARFFTDGEVVLAEFGRDRGVYRVEVQDRMATLRPPERLTPAATPLFAALDETGLRPVVQRHVPLREMIGTGIELPEPARAAGSRERALAFAGSGSFVLAWVEPDGRGAVSIRIATIRCEGG